MSEFSEAEKKELLATAHDLRNVADESLALLAAENEQLRTRLAEAEAALDDMQSALREKSEECDAVIRREMAAEQRGRALLEVSRAVHREHGACGICHRMKHPSGCDCPVAALDAEYPGWRTEWRHGRPHDARMAEDHDEA